MDFGYIRISTKIQNADMQIDALIDFGIDEKNLFKDISSGARAKRPGLDKLLTKIRPGDTVIVWKLDRIARSLSHFVKLINILDEKEVSFKSLTEPFIDTSTVNPHNKFITNIFGCVAELERDLIKERVKEGLNGARRRNVQLGRPKGISASVLKKYRNARKLYDLKDISVDKICEIENISKPYFYSLKKLDDAGKLKN